MGSPTPGIKRSIVYVDGFNLYYWAIRGGPHKWLNLERYFRLLRPNDAIQSIRYFTAKVVGPHVEHQEAYLAALETLPLMKIILGRFKAKQVECKVVECSSHGPRIFSTYEEKRTDVNIAIWMLNDAQCDLCDRLILVTGDSDLVPVISMIKDHYPSKEVIVYIPARNPVRGAAVELRAVADKDKTLPMNFFKATQFPVRIMNGAGEVIEKPPSW